MRSNRLGTPPPEVCPVCGADVPSKALACPTCGADHNSGWRANTASTDGLDLPDEDFDYDAYVQDEFGATAKPRGIKTGWWITAILVLLTLVAMLCF